LCPRLQLAKVYTVKQKRNTYDSDHLALSCSLDVAYYEKEETTRYDYKNLDAKLFADTLLNHLPPLQTLSLYAYIEAFTEVLFNIIQLAIKASTPTLRIAQQLIPGFTLGLKQI